MLMTFYRLTEHERLPVLRHLVKLRSNPELSFLAQKKSRSEQIQSILSIFSITYHPGALYHKSESITVIMFYSGNQCYFDVSTFPRVRLYTVLCRCLNNELFLCLCCLWGVGQTQVLHRAVVSHSLPGESLEGHGGWLHQQPAGLQAEGELHPYV